MKKKYIYVIYHKDCLDGFGSALAAWKKFHKNAEYIPLNPSDPIPEHILHYDSEIYMLDYSKKRDELLHIKRSVKNIVVIDHHLTAQNELRDIPNCHFDMTKSGAVLSWMYFHPDKKIPKLFKYVQDRDLWLKKMKWSDEVNDTLLLGAYPMTFKAWNEIIIDPFTEDKLIHIFLVETGKIIRKQTKHEINVLLESKSLVFFNGYEVYAVNTSLHRSEVAEQLCLMDTSKPFAICYMYQGNKLKVSLRSENDFDVSEIAKLYGGGGHKNAAAFSMNKPFEFK